MKSREEDVRERKKVGRTWEEGKGWERKEKEKEKGGRGKRSLRLKQVLPILHTFFLCKISIFCIICELFYMLILCVKYHLPPFPNTLKNRFPFKMNALCGDSFPLNLKEN